MYIVILLYLDRQWYYFGSPPKRRICFQHFNQDWMVLILIFFPLNSNASFDNSRIYLKKTGATINFFGPSYFDPALVTNEKFDHFDDPCK